MTAEELVNAIQEETEKQHRIKQAESLTQTHADKKNNVVSAHKCAVTKPEPVRADAKIAELFNTSPRYISEAKRLKTTAPEKFQQVLSGEKVLPKRILRRCDREGIRKR